MLAGVRSELSGAIDLLSAGLIDSGQFADIVDGILAQGHAKAFGLGRHLAGNLKIDEFADAALADLVMNEQAEYLARLADDIDAGKFSDQFGLIDKSKLQARTDFYLDRIRGSANQAFVEASQDEDEFDWITKGENCAGCNSLAAASPHQKATLTHFPGDGQTECMVRCDCILRRRRDRRKGFSRVSWD